MCERSLLSFMSHATFSRVSNIFEAGLTGPSSKFLVRWHGEYNTSLVWQTAREFIIAKLSIRKLGPHISVLIIRFI